jgi:formate hydrogenlyase subunit 3/multisubunit Na+/H+ antiporter MnhD subunit
MMLTADFVQSIITAVGFGTVNRSVTIVVLAFGLKLPLSLLRRISSLSFISMFSFGLVAILIAASAVELARSDRHPEHSATTMQRFLRGLAIIVHATLNQNGVCPVFWELRQLIHMPAPAQVTSNESAAASIRHGAVFTFDDVSVLSRTTDGGAVGFFACGEVREK